MRYQTAVPVSAPEVMTASTTGIARRHNGRDAASISLAELLVAVEEGFRMTVCSHCEAEEHADACSHATTCTVKGPMAEVHQRLMGVLRGVTLAELFDPKAKPSALHALPLLAASGRCSSGAVETFPS